MCSESKILEEIITGIFGDEKYHDEEEGQIAVDCPVCSHEIKNLSHGDGKGNLEINYKSGVYKCWACSDTHNTKGRLRSLIRKYGNIRHYREYVLIAPKENKEITVKKSNFEPLPKSFRPLDEIPNIYPNKKSALKYLKNRGVSQEIISKYNVGLVSEGKYSNRIVIPSYGLDGKINFFVTRTWNDNTKFKYLNPKTDKTNLIFNEKFLDYDKDIYIVEGVFDAFFVDNPLIMLGKYLNNYTFEKLYNNAKGNIYICLDYDAWEDALLIYDKLNGGVLEGRIFLVKMKNDSDIAEIKGDFNKTEIINDYIRKI